LPVYRFKGRCVLRDKQDEPGADIGDGGEQRISLVRIAPFFGALHERLLASHDIFDKPVGQPWQAPRFLALNFSFGPICLQVGVKDQARCAISSEPFAGRID
jgi:hypothetical protein